MTFQGENLFVGLVALALLPMIGWRIWRGLREGQLPVYRTRLHREESAVEIRRPARPARTRLPADRAGRGRSSARPRPQGKVVTVIRIAAAVIVDEGGRTLLVRKRGTAAYMQAGGKLGEGERRIDALRREIQEELGCDIGGAPSALGRFSAPAANEPGRMVEAELFAVTLAGEIRPAAEIEDAIWHDPDDLDSIILAPLTRDHALPLARDLRRRI